MLDIEQLTTSFYSINYYGETPRVMCVLQESLKILASTEEPLLRRKAVDALRKIAYYHSNADLEKHFVVVLKQLAESEKFTSRTSACYLFSVSYPRVSTFAKAVLRM